MRNATLTLVRDRGSTTLTFEESAWCAVVSGAPLPTAAPDGCGRAGTTFVGGPGTAVVTVGTAPDSSSAVRDRSSLVGAAAVAAITAAIMLQRLARV